MNELMQTVAENLKRNGFEVYTVATADEAKQKALSLIQPDWNVGVGGSMTIRQLGLTEALEAAGLTITTVKAEEDWRCVKAVRR